MQITKDQLNQIECAVIRKEQVAQGMFDGRFKTRSVQSKKAYSRKQKHKGSDW